MSDNKVNNKLDFRNVKNSQFGGAQTDRMEFSELQSSKRVYHTTPILKDAYTHFIQQTNVDGYPTFVEYWQATSSAKDKLQFSPDVAGSKAGTYIVLQEYLTKRTHVLYYVVSGSGVAPGIGDIETPINIVTNDSAALITYATKLAIDAIDEFTATQNGLLSSFLEIEYFQFGETSAINVGTTGFISTRLENGESFKVGEVVLDYDVNGYPIYNGSTLKGLLYNPYTTSFDVERDEVTVTSIVDLGEVISSTPEIFNLSMPVSGTEYNLVLPTGVNRFKVNVKDHLCRYTLGYSSGSVFITRTRGEIYEESDLQIKVADNTLYFTANRSNMVMQVITWK